MKKKKQIKYNFGGTLSDLAPLMNLAVPGLGTVVGTVASLASSPTNYKPVRQNENPYGFQNGGPIQVEPTIKPGGRITSSMLDRAMYKADTLASKIIGGDPMLQYLNEKIIYPSREKSNAIYKQYLNEVALKRIDPNDYIVAEPTMRTTTNVNLLRTDYKDGGMYQSGGVYPSGQDKQLSQDSYQVKYPGNRTDAKSYGNYQFDKDEVIDMLNQFVFSDEKELGIQGMSPAELVKPHKKAKGKAQKKLEINPYDNEAKNTAMISDLNALSIAQNQEAKKQYDYGAKVNPELNNYQYGGPVDPPRDTIPNNSPWPIRVQNPHPMDKYAQIAYAYDHGFNPRDTMPFNPPTGVLNDIPNSPSALDRLPGYLDSLQTAGLNPQLPFNPLSLIPGQSVPMSTPSTKNRQPVDLNSLISFIPGYNQQATAQSNTPTTPRKSAPKKPASNFPKVMDFNPSMDTESGVFPNARILPEMHSQVQYALDSTLNTPTDNVLSRGTSVNPNYNINPSLEEDVLTSNRSNVSLPPSRERNNPLEGFTFGDALQGIEALSTFRGLGRGPEIDPLYQMQTRQIDDAPIRRNIAQGFNAATSNINTSSASGRTAALNNLYANRLKQESDALTQLASQNKQLASQTEQYNIGQRRLTDDINARNRGAFDQAQTAAFQTIGNTGRALNKKKQGQQAMKYLEATYPEVFKLLMNKIG